MNLQGKRYGPSKCTKSKGYDGPGRRITDAWDLEEDANGFQVQVLVAKSRPDL